MGWGFMLGPGKGQVYLSLVRFNHWLGFLQNPEQD